MSRDDSHKPIMDAPSNRAEIDAFITKVKTTVPAQAGGGKGRLIFALDATASRQPTWDMASQLQGQMFEAVAGLGGLQIQLCFYRGFGECRTSKWLSDAQSLHRAMSKIRCAAGQTQIERVLKHALAEQKQQEVSALVFIGDCMEENIDRLAATAGKMGLMKVPLFVFQEGYDPIASDAFATLARLSGGAHCRFDTQSADQLRELLTTVAVYASGGAAQLAKISSSSKLVQQIKQQLIGPRSQDKNKDA